MKAGSYRSQSRSALKKTARGLGSELREFPDAESLIRTLLPNKLEYKTVLYYKVLLRYKTVFFGTISVQTSILLYKTVFYRIQNYVTL